MKKENVLLVVIVLIVGVLVGVLVSKTGKGPGKSGQAPSAPPPAAVPAVNRQQTIQVLEGLVAKDPTNRNAWTELGHNYFDSDQPVKAIEAYDKALALGPDDPNVLTDQGLMFRRLGQYDRAIENFSKANAIDPNHPQSLFNMGVVYRYDLQDFRKAKEVWDRYLVINPSGPGAELVRAELQALEQLLGPGMAFPPAAK